MLLYSIGSNAEFVSRFGVTNKIKRIAKPNPHRQSGLIVNRSTSDCLVELGGYPHRLIHRPLRSIRIPAHGGNFDIPLNYTGAIWVKWIDPMAKGTLKVHHYYSRTS
jgi:hypothetical protein